MLTIRNSFKDNKDFAFNGIVFKAPEEPNGLWIVIFKCPICEKHHAIILDNDSVEAYINGKESGKSIQEIFPDMSKEFREKFISQICSNCQKLLFEGE